MARYIDTSKVHIPKGFFNDLNVPKLFDWLNSQPTADVVEVVRCKDCIHYKDEWCEILKEETPIADGFCCYGERKREDDR